MEFIAMRSLSRELSTVLEQLRRKGELVVTNNGKPTILMVNLVGKDLVEVVSGIRKQQEDQTKAQRQKEALERLWAGMQSIDDEPFDEEFDAIIARRPLITQEVDTGSSRLIRTFCRIC